MKIQFEQIVEQIGTVILGKEEQIRLALTCLFARGHLLIEDIPGVGKTTLAKVLSICLGLNFQRIQCTSDMLPGDVLGTSVFDRKSGSFVFNQGPIFTHVLLADEINRTTPKTQSALLEAMGEQQVTVDGQTMPLDPPFFVIATQNPLEHYGTFPLPESQVDRFLMRIELGYPEREAEKKLLKAEDAADILAKMKACLLLEDVKKFQQNTAGIHISDALLEYLQDILDFTRTSSHFYMGLSPRAGLALLQATRSWAFIHGRDFALPEDMQRILLPVVGHRLSSSDDLSLVPHDRLKALLMEVPIP
ncbi:MAG: MoxR family ATPase [Desulfobacterales bacterium]|nr:MAG: MoxR family ATPase [Desulfobacterales bacterium]